MPPYYVIGAMVRCRVTVLGAALFALVQSAGVARAEVVGSEVMPTTVQVSGSTVVWSSYDTVAGSYFVAARRSGVTARLPLRGRPVPFDLDLGIDKAGRTLLVYSRCETEAEPLRSFRPDWTSGGRCRIFEFDFRAGRERQIGLGGLSTGASVALPAVWGNRVAFAYARTPRSPVQLYTADRRSGRRRLPVPGGTGDGSHPAPTSIDLSSSHFAFVWGNIFTGRCESRNMKLADAAAEDAWLVRLPDRRRRLARACETTAFTSFDSIALTRTKVRFRALGRANEILSAPLAGGRRKLTAMPSPTETTVSYSRSGSTTAFVATGVKRGPGYTIEVVSGELPR